MKTKRIALTLKIAFGAIFVSYLFQSCNSDIKPATNELNAIALASFMSPDSWPMPELSEKELQLVDSIFKLDVFVKYHKAYQQLIKKTNSYFAGLSSNELEELAKNSTDSVFLSTFMTKMKSHIDIQKELEAVEKAGKDFDMAIADIELTEAEKAALIIKRFK